MKRRGRKSAAQTPAPKKERITGSKKNKPKSASSSGSSTSIKFSENTTSLIREVLSKYNKNNPSKKISLPTAKKVVRRGMGAYSTSHRPTITGGRPNSRTAWGLARLHAFMRKKTKSKTANGTVRSREIKKSYVQDNDLL